MRLHRLASFVSLSALSMLCVVAPGKTANADATPSPARVAMEMRAGSTRPFLVHGELSAPSTKAKSVIALDAVARHVSFARGLDLSATRTLSGPDGSSVVVLSQTMNGIPVAQRGARVVIEADGRVTMLTLELEEKRPTSLVPTLTADDAIRIARKEMITQAPHAALVVWTGGGAPRLSYVVQGGVIGLPTRPVTVVDATTGEVVVRYETAVSLGKAKVYEQNPVATKTTSEVTLDNDPAKAGLESTSVVARNCIDKKTVKDVDFGISLKVHICDLVATIVPDASGDYLDILPGTDKEPEDKYAELSMYYHTSKAYAFARGIGLVSTSQLTATSNLRIPQGFSGGFDPAKLSNPDLPLVPFDNAFFAPSDPTFSAIFGIEGDAMWFGQGTLVDFGYDGDVVYHEFGHFVVNSTAQLVGENHLDKFGASVSPGAMNEGLADVHSSFITGDPYVGEYAAKELGGGKGIRQLDNTKTFPGQLVGEVHNDSEPFSAAIWKPYATLDATKKIAFQKAWLTALNAVPSGNLGFGELAKILVTTVTAKVDAATGTALRASFDERNIVDGDPRVRDANAKVTAVEPQLHFASPGKKSVSSKGDLAPGIIQMKYDAPSGGTGTIHVSMLTAVAATGSPLGGTTGTPFAPVLLVKPGADPIAFTYSPTASDATSIPCVLAADKKSATCDGDITLEAPAGSTAPVHLMIANTGDVDGAYDDVVVTADIVPAPTDDAGVDAGPTDDSGVADTGTPDAPAADSSSGCGCTIPGNDTTSSTATLAVAVLGLGLVARRRKR